ncbi:MAG TPA: MerR family transcriptional regulator [Anaerolineales bacterium]|nr:MerR family transcriptional regulator [Anaerolineales bacterium]
MAVEISKKPIHNIKSVSEKTGIAPVTLRAWERRYNFPVPQRTDTGYRLYSEHDIASLNWLKLQTESGLSIGQAIKLLNGLLETGENPLAHQINDQTILDPPHQSIEQVQPALVKALIELDEEKANRIMRTSFSMYPLETILLEIIAPTMVEVGDRWHRNEISVATEHFATHHCRLHLMHALEATNDIAKQGSIVAACAPHEWHELGILILVTILRLRGWNVTYLGANLSLERLSEVLVHLKPQMVLFSATRKESAEALMPLTNVLDELPDPKPIIGLGGQAFLQNPSLTNKVPGTFLGPLADEAVQQIERMLAVRN